jgi:class 3 adenylate cyclase/HAMP domain-containing protein
MKATGWFSGFHLLGVFGGRGGRRLVRDYFLVSLFLVGGGLVTSGLLEIYFRYFESREQISQLRGEVAAGAAFKIEQFLLEIERTMRGATKSQDIFLEGVSPEYVFELRKLLLIAPPVTEAVAIDETGVARTQVSRLRAISPGDRRDLSTTPAFWQAARGKSYFGPVYYVKRSEPYMTIAVPIELYAGKVIGVLQAEVNLKYIWDMISAIQVGKAGYAYVVARYGDLIAHPDLSLVLQRRNLAHLGQVKSAFSRSNTIPNAPRGIIAENLQGEKIFSSHALIPTLDWAVIIEQPVEEAYEKLYASLFRTSGLLLVGLGIAFLASFFMVRRVIRPLEKLRRGAELIGSGNLEHRLEIKTGDELEVLAGEFNKMTAALQEAYAGLEQKVEERTRELVDANQKLEVARRDLEEWNQTLEEKVQKQVNELERAGRIKRFLSPQVAESVLNSDGVDPFQTHRREVTVVFIDLRGFTDFSDAHEPEEVMQFLRNYHEEIGNLIFKYEGTLEHFAGDGIMVFFNDPIPREDHTELAARMAIEVQSRINELRPVWRSKGYALDLGIGMAAGFATLGTIGFEGRMDYGAIGNVTIMASRLSSEAQGGQILTNIKTLAKIEDLVEAQSLGEMQLKGFTRPVPTFSISKLK